MIKNIKENLGVDIRGHTLVSQKPRTYHFIRLHLLQTFDCLILLSLVGRIVGVLTAILANIYLNQEMQVLLIL